LRLTSFSAKLAHSRWPFDQSKKWKKSAQIAKKPPKPGQKRKKQAKFG